MKRYEDFVEEWTNYAASHSELAGNCRDCADQIDGICHMTGIPCGSKYDIVKRVVNAITYGLDRAFIDKPKELTVREMLDSKDLFNYLRNEYATNYGMGCSYGVALGLALEATILKDKNNNGR